MGLSLAGVAASAAAIALAAVLPAQASVVNGGFETGDFSGWTRTGDTSFSGVHPSAAESGSYGAFFGPPTLGGISQSFATLAGTTYEVRFSLSLPDGAPPNRFLWSWNGLAQTPGFTNAASFSYTDYASLVSATDASSTIAFTFRDPLAYWFLDNVSVTPVPELPIHALLGAGLLVVAALKRRSARRRVDSDS